MLLDDVQGRPAEARFRSLEVGADAGWEGLAGVSCRSCRDRLSRNDVRDGILLFFDVGLAAIECCGWPKARPTAATPRVPDAQSY